MQPVFSPRPWAPVDDAVPGTSPSTLRIRYEGFGGSLFVLMVKNLLLTLVTLGIYLPWARTERRKYLWQNISVGGQRLRYHGTGRELLFGYAKLFVGYLVSLGALAVAQHFGRTAGAIVQIVLAVALVGLVPVAIYGALRYRLSRTSLRNVRFGLEPGLGEFWKKYLAGLALVVVTLGVYAPVFQNRMHAFVMRRTHYGSQRFDYDGTDREAFVITMTGVLLSVVTFGIYFPWYLAKRARFRMEHTAFQGARGRLDLSGADIFVLGFVSVFGTLLTLGIAFPWIMTYVMRVFAEKISFVGEMDFVRIERRAFAGDAAADGLADALDVGLQI